MALRWKGVFLQFISEVMFVALFLGDRTRNSRIIKVKCETGRQTPTLLGWKMCFFLSAGLPQLLLVKLLHFLGDWVAVTHLEGVLEEYSARERK